MKTKTFLLLTLFILLVGALSFTVLLSNSPVIKKHDKISKLFSKPVIYKSTDQNTHSDIRLNYKDSTYTYQEKYIMTPGDDAGYDYHSEGKFRTSQGMLIFYSDMPSNHLFSKTVLHLTDEETARNKFSYLYPIDEKVNSDQVKIYFDNIAETEDYEAFTIVNHQLKPVKIIERRKLAEQKSVKTKNDNFFLIHYLVIEKPANNQLLIISPKTNPTSESFLFDLNKIPYRSFHFFTRAYWRYYDFTGVKFKITAKGLKKISEPNDKRYSENPVLNGDFLKQ